MALRRLIDLPGMEEIERKALMNPRYADADARVQFPDLDETSMALFGLTADAAQDVERPADWDGIDCRPVRDQIAAFEREGWDVTDNRRKPPRTFEHFTAQLWLAVRGVAGTLPFAPADEEQRTDWGSALQADLKKFKRDRR